jgi:hypothetical protein
MHYESDSCPHCRNIYGTHLLGLRSGLGTPYFYCKSCRKPFGSNCREWLEMSSFDKVWYFTISLIYTIVVAVAAGFMLQLVLGTLLYGPQSKFSDANSQKLMWLGATLGAASVVLFQTWRIIRSIGRSNLLNPPSQIASYLSPHTNAQMLYGFVFMAMLGIAFLISWAKS